MIHVANLWRSARRWRNISSKSVLVLLHRWSCSHPCRRSVVIVGWWGTVVVGRRIMGVLPVVTLTFVMIPRVVISLVVGISAIEVIAVLGRWGRGGVTPSRTVWRSASTSVARGRWSRLCVFWVIRKFNTKCFAIDSLSKIRGKNSSGTKDEMQLATNVVLILQNFIYLFYVSL